jgi:iron-sulfur cluster repair protein YtfE (RIC family)
MKRNDLYSTVHKGLRAALFELAADAARVDSGADHELRALVARLRRLLGFLEEHGRHEDAHVMPLLAEADFGLAQFVEREHAQLEASLSGLEVLAAQLNAATNGSRAVLTAELQRHVERLVAEQLIHMQREETQVNTALWERFSDEDLERAHQRILAAIAPARMAEWLELMLPALSELERAGLVAMLHARAPREAFEALTAKARARLGPEAWTRLCMRAAIAAERIDVQPTSRSERAG